MPNKDPLKAKRKYDKELGDFKSFQKPQSKNKSRYLKGGKITPQKISGNVSIVDLVEKYFQAYNAGRLSDACNVFVNKMLDEDVTIGMSLTGALTPAGLGSSIRPLIEYGFVDWIVSTGANMYHDTHFALGHSLYRGNPFVDDKHLRKEWVIRIYDVLFDGDVLFHTDAFYRKLIMLPEFQKKIPSSEFYYRLGKYLYNIEKKFGVKDMSVLSTAYKCGVPIYTSSPGDSSIGLNVAEVELVGSKMEFDVNRDVNETAAIVLNAKRRGYKGKPGKSGVVIFGGGSPKNFILQTEPQIQEVMGIEEKGHDYFLQFTDARPDTGGLSGATPSEAVSWGKVDPNQLPDTIVCYADTTIVMPILTAYALKKHKKRKLKRMAEKTDELLQLLIKEYKKANK
jgi:deoxyhypusine synthase